MTDLTTIDALLAAIAHEKKPVEVLGHTVELQPPTILQCVRLVKRFPKLIDLFEDKYDNKGVRLPDELQPSLMSVLIEAGGEAVAAFVACAAGREGDAAVEKSFASAPDALTLKLFPAAVKITLGDGSIQDFFTKVQVALAEAGILKIVQAKPSESPTAEAA